MTPRLPADAGPVLRMLAAGETITKIARTEGVSKSSMNMRLARLRELVGARNVAHLVAIAYRQGLLTPGGGDLMAVADAVSEPAQASP